MPAPRSPEIITEPVIAEGAASLADWIDSHAACESALSLDQFEEASAFIRYWAAVGSRLDSHGYRARAELEATFDLAFAAAGLDGWKCYGSRDAELIVHTPKFSTPPLFSTRWREPGDSLDRSYGGPVDRPCWYAEDGYWQMRGGGTHDNIAALLAHYSERAA